MSPFAIYVSLPSDINILASEIGFMAKFNATCYVLGGTYFLDDWERSKSL
jgi:hypothetical protein